MPKTKPKILMLTPYLPFPLLSGGQIRSYNLLKQLQSHYDVTLFALIKEESESQYLGEIQKICHRVKVFKRSKKPFTLSNILKTGFSWYPFLVIRNHVPSMTKAIKEILKTEQFDLIHAETFYMMPHLPETKVPVILAEQTIEYLGYQSFANKQILPIKALLQIDIAKIKYWEQKYWRTANHLIVMSSDDQQFISDQGCQTASTVVANGVDSTWFSDYQRQKLNHPTLLFVGTFKWLPNMEAVEYLVSEVWPKLKQQIESARLWIVGNAPTPKVFEYQKKDNSITVTGGIPDIRDAFTGASVLVAPIFSGKGTRYKILEAMACGTPIVGTKLSVEGLQITNGVHYLQAETPHQFVKQLTKLLSNTQLQKKLAKNGQDFVRANFDWHQIGQDLLKVYQQLISNSVQ